MNRLAPAMVVAAFISLPLAALAQDHEKGKAIYAARKCQSCHSIEGKGSKKYPLDGVGKKLSGEEISKWITDPASQEAKLAQKPKVKMKPTKLPDEDLKALVEYMQSLK